MNTLKISVAPEAGVVVPANAGPFLVDVVYSRTIGGPTTPALADMPGTIQTATEMFDHFSRLFQRTLRQLNNHRLTKLKAKKLQAEIRWLHRKAREARVRSRTTL